MHEDPVGPASQQDSSIHVFVYGTLRQGQDNDITRLQPAPCFLGHAEVNGTLFHLGAYPGLMLGGTGRVQGEVYAIEPALECRLDEIEGLYPQPNDEYFKRSLPIAVQGRLLRCILYEINPRFVEGARTILSGDWVRGQRA